MKKDFNETTFPNKNGQVLLGLRPRFNVAKKNPVNLLLIVKGPFKKYVLNFWNILGGC